MPVKRIVIFVLPLLLCLGAAVHGDTVILKSGEKIEGKILNETDEEMTISVQVTATIKDERVVKKAEIDKVLKVQADVEAWTPIASLAPGLDSLERDDYGRISVALEYFMTSFPDSTFLPQAKAKLADFAAEQKRVEAGEMKMDGQWLTKEKVMEERVQIGGRILLNRMKRAAGAGQLTDAMAVFDQFATGFTGSASYPDAVDLARQVLASLKTSVTQRLAQYKKTVEDDKKRMLTAKGTERDQLAAILKNDRTKADAAVAAAEKAGVKWLPLQPATERSLTSLSSKVTSEAVRLNSLRVEKMKESVKSTEVAATALVSGDVDGAEKALTDATTAWADNEMAKRLRLKLTELKKAATDANREQPKPTPTPKPKPGPTASTTTTTQPVQEEAPPPETSFFKRPTFFIVLAVVVAFGAIAGKFVAKSRASGGNTSDQ